MTSEGQGVIPRPSFGTSVLLSFSRMGKGSTNLVINSPASVRSKAGRTNGLIERLSPDSYPAFEPREADFPAIFIPPIRRKYFDEVWAACERNVTGSGQSWSGRERSVGKSASN
jgi:hypothetical protein